MVVRLRAIGECAIDVGPTRVGPDAELAFAVLLVLAMAGGHTVARRRLTDLLWPGAPDDRARHNLRQTLYKLRQLGAPVESESLHVWLPTEAVAPNPLLDADADGDGVEPAELLRADRPFGEFLAGYVPTFSAPFAAWIDEQRSVVHARLRRAALTRLHDDRRRGDWAAVETLARKVLQLDALNEEATLALAEATVMSGSKRAAIALLDAYLRDLGADAGDIRLPATLLRRRIAERLPPSLSPPDGDACFVGRAESMAFLHDQFRLARTSGARTVLVWGDAGIGKSRLTTEFARLAVMEGAQLARVGCQARDVERPLSIFVDVVPYLLALPGAIGCSPESMTYLRRLTAHDPTVLEPAAETREAELLFAYVRRSIFDLVDAVAAESSLLLVFEDVHWLDEQSWRVLRELIGWLERRRVLVVLTSRLPHATPTRPARGAAGVVEHRLGPLDREASLALFDAATPGGVVPAEYREWCVQVADGNPLFVGSLGAYWVSTRKTAAPRELTELIDERLKRLSRHSLQVLQACAVLDAQSDFDSLERVLEMTRRDLLACIEQLSYHNLLSGRGTTLRCKHVLIRDAAMRTLCDANRRMLYRCKAEALSCREGVTTSSATRWATIEAWLECGDRVRALEVVLSCGLHLQSVGLAEDAADVYERALQADLLPQESEAIMHQHVATLSTAGRWRRLLEAARAHRRTLPLGDASRHTFGVHRIKAAWHLSDARLSNAALKSLRAYSLSPTATPQMRAEAAALGVAVADNCCRGADLDMFARVLQQVQSGPGVDSRTVTEALLIFHTSHGDLEEAVRRATELVACDRRHSDQVRLARNLRIASIPLRRSGAFAPAEAAAREAFDIANRVGAHAQTLAAIEAICYTFFDQDRISEIMPWIQYAEQLAVQHGHRRLPSGLQAVAARAALELEEDAESLTDVVSRSCPDSHDPVARRQSLLLALTTHKALRLGDEEHVARHAPRLDAAFELTRAWGGQDYCAWVLCAALSATDQTHHARSAAAEYLGRHRREAFPAPMRLQRIVG